MSLLGYVGILFLVLFGASCLWMILDNTRVLNEEKVLKRDFAELAHEMETVENPTPEQCLEWSDRADALQARYDEWRKSPFVIGG